MAEVLTGPLAKFSTDILDETGTDIMISRSGLWGLVNPRQNEAAESYTFSTMGKTVARDIIDYNPDFSHDTALELASLVAVQNPPLLGRHMLEFMTSADKEFTERGLI